MLLCCADGGQQPGVGGTTSLLCGYIKGVFSHFTDDAASSERTLLTRHCCYPPLLSLRWHDHNCCLASRRLCQERSPRAPSPTSQTTQECLETPFYERGGHRVFTFKPKTHSHEQPSLSFSRSARCRRGNGVCPMQATTHVTKPSSCFQERAHAKTYAMYTSSRFRESGRGTNTPRTMSEVCSSPTMPIKNAFTHSLRCFFCNTKWKRGRHTGVSRTA